MRGTVSAVAEFTLEDQVHRAPQGFKKKANYFLCIFVHFTHRAIKIIINFCLTCFSLVW